MPRIEAFVSNNGTMSTQVIANNAGAPTTGTWYGVALVVDAANNQLRLRAGSTSLSTADTASHTADGTSGDHVFQRTEAWRWGRGTSNKAANFMDGLIDEGATFNGALSDAMLDAWWNGGNPLPISNFGMIGPSIWTHGATASIDVNAGDTPSITVAAYGNLPMSEALTGTNAASYSVTDNNDGTWTVARTSPISAGTETFTLTLGNAAGSDATAFTVNAASGVTPQRIIISHLRRLADWHDDFVPAPP